MSADLDRMSVDSCASSTASSSPSSAALGGQPGAGGGAAGIRLLSANVRKLHGALNLLLSEAEREQFIHCLNAYHCRRNVFDLVQTLKVLLDGAEKRQLLPMLRLVIPRSDQLLFDQYTSEGLYLKADFLPAANGASPGGPPDDAAAAGSPRSLAPAAAAAAPPPPAPPPAARFWPPPLASLRSQPGFSTTLEGTAPLGASGLEELRGEVRQVTLKRNKAQEGLGFSIRGGSEHGVGIYVSLVEPGSLAEKEGLRVGDQILKVNDKPLDKVTHAEAVKALKGSKKLNLSVHSVGRIPGGYVTNHIYTWVDPQGRSVSPPTGLPQHQSSSLRKDGEKRSHLQLLQEGDEKKVNLVLNEGRSLGLMIRGGAEYALGIYITGVDKGSEAESTGLKVGDQILEVNGRSFLSIPHDEAVKLLKSSRHLIMTVKDIGRLPHARTTVDETKWIASSQIEETVVNPAGFSGDHAAEVIAKPSFYRGLAGSQVTLSSLVNQSRVMLEEQARHLLNEPERATMGYYLDEYKENNIPVDALVMALFELLNTHAKFSLLSEVRGVISPQDLDRFDNLVLKREIEFMKARQPSGTGTGTDSYSIMSYSDTVSSAGSHFTSTTVSSARAMGNTSIVQQQHKKMLKGIISDCTGDGNGQPLLYSTKDNHRALLSPGVYTDLTAQLYGRSSILMKQPTIRRENNSSIRGSLHRRLPPPFQHLTYENRDVLVTPLSSSQGPPPRRHTDDKALLMVVNQNTSSDLEGGGNGCQSSVNALPDISLDDISSFPEDPPPFKPPPPTSSSQPADPSAPLNKNAAKDTVTRPSSESSQSGLFFVAPRNPTPPPSLSEKDTSSIASSTATSSTEDSVSSTIYASVSTTHASRRTMDAHLSLVNQHPIGPFPRVQSPTRLKNLSPEAPPTGFLPNPSAPSPSPPPPPPHPAPPPPSEKGGPEASPTQHFIMVEVHRPNSEPDVNEVRSLPQARAILPLSSAPASTLSQLSDSGQTLSEDSGVDIGDTEPSTKDRSRPPAPIKSRSPQEAPRADGLVEAGPKPPGLLEPMSHLIRVTKSAPTLGIAIEGGANTRQPLPRIVTIQRGGSAHNCGKLKVGHVILEVNGVALRGKEHREAARLIAEAFKTKDKDYVDFLVTEFNIAL